MVRIQSPQPFCGSSSAVESHVANVDVASSNLVSRSILFMYEIGDIVLIKSCASDDIPHVHARLTKKIEAKGYKGHTIVWSSFTGWECVLIYPEEAELLRKQWGIPFKPPDDMQTYTYETDIIKKISQDVGLKPHRRITKSKKRTN